MSSFPPPQLTQQSVSSHEDSFCKLLPVSRYTLKMDIFLRVVFMTGRWLIVWWVTTDCWNVETDDICNWVTVNCNCDNWRESNIMNERQDRYRNRYFKRVSWKWYFLLSMTMEMLSLMKSLKKFVLLNLDPSGPDFDQVWHFSQIMGYRV